MVSLVAIGGFAGVGKSVVSRRLAEEFALPRLCSDTMGQSITQTLGDRVPRADAFRAGYDLLFRLAEDFVAAGCSVIVDTNLGWEFQWRWLDHLAERLPDATVRPVILRCPKRVCAERMNHRHRQDPANLPPADEVLAIPHVTGVWEYLQTLNRPDIHFVDADRDAESVYADVHHHLTGSSVR